MADQFFAESTNMTLQRMPRVMVTLELLPKGAARRKLADRLARGLSEHFGAIHVFPRVIVPMAFLKFKVSGVDFAVGILRRKPQGPSNGEWYVTIDPLDAPAPLTNSTSDDQGKYAKNLRLISDEIHALLSSAPGVTRLRWFLEGWDAKKPAVRTPAELPWQVDVRELQGTLDLSGRGSMSPSKDSSPRGGRIFAFMQRHPSFVSFFARIIVVSRLLGAMMAAIGILLSLRFLGGLAHGDGLTNIWLSGTIGTMCLIVGVCALNVLMPVYRVQRTTTCAPED